MDCGGTLRWYRKARMPFGVQGRCRCGVPIIWWYPHEKVPTHLHLRGKKLEEFERSLATPRKPPRPEKRC